MTPEQERAEARKALEEATPGPWFAGTRGGQCHINHKHGNGDCVYDLVLSHSEDWIETTLPGHEIFEYDYDGTRIKRKEDAYFISYAPTWLRNSLDREEQLIAENERLREDGRAMLANWNAAGKRAAEFGAKVAEQDKEIQKLREERNAAVFALTEIADDTHPATIGDLHGLAKTALNGLGIEPTEIPNEVEAEG